MTERRILGPTMKLGKQDSLADDAEYQKRRFAGFMQFQISDYRLGVRDETPTVRKDFDIVPVQPRFFMREGFNYQPTPFDDQNPLIKLDASVQQSYFQDVYLLRERVDDGSTPRYVSGAYIRYQPAFMMKDKTASAVDPIVVGNVENLGWYFSPRAVMVGMAINLSGVQRMRNEALNGMPIQVVPQLVIDVRSFPYEELSPTTFQNHQEFSKDAARGAELEDATKQFLYSYQMALQIADYPAAYSVRLEYDTFASRNKISPSNWETVLTRRPPNLGDFNMIFESVMPVYAPLDRIKMRLRHRNK